MITFEKATDLSIVRTLFREYAHTLPIALDFQGFEEELSALPGKYAEPEGRLVIARVDGHVAACIGLRRFDAMTGEIKRLYVRPAYRGRGLAKLLTVRMLAEAQAIGYERVVLDTLRSMTPAINLYLAMGFHEIEAYYPNPYDAVYFEKQLKTPK
jgi:ribosomal protein S18 acetylase RimI-like enzyme